MSETGQQPSYLLGQRLTLPCGAVLPNRIVKSAMSEGLADGAGRATPRHATLYNRWGAGGAGMLITGNVMIDRQHLENAGNICIDGPQDDSAMNALRAVSAAGKSAGAVMVMQLNHAGRQVPRAINPHPKSASDVALVLGKRFAKPTPMSGGEVEDVIARFVHGARVAQDSGFDGVQVHGAHGYLVSQFLSPLTNRRSDQWGGSLADRVRLLLELIRRIRSACGTRFIVGVKLNSADFQRGGFSEDDSVQVAAWLEGAGADFIEVSGGNYEQPRMMNIDRLDPLATRRDTTRLREAYFMDFAPRLRRATALPIMVTGGFRTATTMARALVDGVDLIGLARPMTMAPQCPATLLEGQSEPLNRRESDLSLGPGWLGPNSPVSMIRDLNAAGIMAWYTQQITNLADGGEPDGSLPLWRALRGYIQKEKSALAALKQT
ncbi:MAG: NADH:flavin oxidoreductase/NADH oxidase family protein [Paracoccaceae bacterium]